jgi:predicted nucleotide-binding protein (sugar kinase/HSP70/actin superfamily)
MENKDSFKSIDETLDNINDLDVGITQRVFCIMSYYPFFTFFEEILRNLINIVKMERLAIYKHN